MHFLTQASGWELEENKNENEGEEISAQKSQTQKQLEKNTIGMNNPRISRRYHGKCSGLSTQILGLACRACYYSLHFTSFITSDEKLSQGCLSHLNFSVCRKSDQIRQMPLPF